MSTPPTRGDSRGRPSVADAIRGAARSAGLHDHESHRASLGHTKERDGILALAPFRPGAFDPLVLPHDEPARSHLALHRLRGRDEARERRAQRWRGVLRALVGAEREAPEHVDHVAFGPALGGSGRF